MCARSVHQILSIKGEYTFRFSNSLIIGLSNYLADSLYCITCFQQNHLNFFIKEATIKARPRWYPTYIGFLVILNALSRNTLSAAVLLFKYLKLHKLYHFERKLHLIHFHK